MSTVVGLDIGGTKIAAAELHGSSLSEVSLYPTEVSSADALIAQLVQIVAGIRGNTVDAVGIGVPSVVDFETGTVAASVNTPLRNLPLRSLLGERLGMPVFVDNDATVAAFAEAHDEQLRRITDNLMMLTLGTGLGGGIVIGGRIYRGASGAAAEIGHTLVAVDVSDGVPTPTAFPQPGSAESLASGKALDGFARHAGYLDGVAIVDALEAGDPRARAIVTRWAEYVGIAVANAINTFDPDEVVLGGGAARVGELLLERARTTAAGYVLPGVGRRTTVRLARHGVRAGVLGAALLAAEEFAGVRV